MSEVAFHCKSRARRADRELLSVLSLGLAAHPRTRQERRLPHSGNATPHDRTCGWGPGGSGHGSSTGQGWLLESPAILLGGGWEGRRGAALPLLPASTEVPVGQPWGLPRPRPYLCPTQVSAVGYGMDEVGQDQHEARLKELFDSFDTTGTGSLGQEELTDLCHMLSLEEVAPVLQETLLQDNLLGRVRSGEEGRWMEVGAASVGRERWVWGRGAVVTCLSHPGCVCPELLT